MLPETTGGVPKTIPTFNKFAFICPSPKTMNAGCVIPGILCLVELHVYICPPHVHAAGGQQHALPRFQADPP